MSDERTGRRTAGNALQRGCLHLGVAVLIEEVAHGTQHGGTLKERVFHAIVNDEVHVTLTGTQLGVVKLVVSHAILVLNDGQGLEALAKNGQLLGVHADFARLGLEDETLNADDVTDVEQLLENLIVEVFIFARTDVIARNIDLNSAFAILKFRKAGLSHHTTAHHTAGNHNLGLLFFAEESFYICRISI